VLCARPSTKILCSGRKDGKALRENKAFPRASTAYNGEVKTELSRWGFEVLTTPWEVRRKMISLSLAQKQILYGILLGDGYLQPASKENARLRLEHSIKQKNYLLWKAKIFSPLFQGRPKYLERIHPKTKRKYKYWRYQSYSNPLLGKFRKVFYSEGRKKIPEKIENYLNPRTLAVWHMDDGYFCKRDNSGYLYLGKMTREDLERASKAIRKVFGIKNTILDKKNKGLVLYFSPKNLRKLKKIIKPYLFFEFRYKLPS